MFGKNEKPMDDSIPATPPVHSQTRQTRPTSTRGGQDSITAYLGPDVSIEGTLRFDHSVLIEGSFKGTIESQGQLVIGEQAEVDADIKSRNVSIKGNVTGTINASERVQVQGNATVMGDITTPSLQMDETVTFEGKCSMRGSNKKQEAKRDERNAEQSKNDIIDAVETVKS